MRPSFLSRDGSADWRDENTKKFVGERGNFRGCYVEVKGSVNGEPLAALVLDVGADKPLELGEGLRLDELEWLSSEISEYTQKH